MELTFDKIHEVVLEALGLKRDYSTFCKAIGKWYYIFLKSPDEKLIIHIPRYEDESISIAYDYIRLFSLTYRIINRPELSVFENTCLFNIFNYNKRMHHFSNNTKSTIDFVKKEGDVLYWTDSILIAKDRFIPVFFKEQIENSNWEVTYNTFKLFKIIENKGLISHPVLINFKEDLCLSLSTSDLKIKNDYVLFKTVTWDSKEMDDEIAAAYEEELREKDIAHQITIKYPYHKNIHTWLSNIGKKNFDLIFNSRFYYQNVVEDGLYLLPKELHENAPAFNDFSTKFRILDTNHSLPLFKALNEFRSAWRVYEFNRFTTPFPKYWFLFVNQSIPKEEWYEMFKTDYPDVAERPIISSIKEIIELIYDLNWSKSFIEETNNPVLLLPEIRGLKKKKLEKSLNSFKNYLLRINSNTVFVENNEDYEYNQYGNLLVLDGFNIINLINIFQQNDDLQILIPDFLYFNYQPWIQFQLLNYQFDALLNPKRELLDYNFIANKEVFSNQRSEIINGIKSAIIKYRRKYNVEEEILVTEENLSVSEDIVFSNEEELEISHASKEKTTETELQIETTDGNVFKLKSSNQVLLQRASVISCRASYLVAGDSFITMNEISYLIDKDAIINNLSKIPDTVVNFQIELGKKIDVYHTLEKQGLVYKSEKYFNQKYVVSEDEYTSEKFILPKRKEHWKIICDYLGINSIDLNQAWISHYGRRHINEIKSIYTHIFNLCIDGEYLSEIENPQLINIIAKFLEEKKELFEEGEGTNTIDLAKSILSALINELSFHQVKEIKTN